MGTFDIIKGLAMSSLKDNVIGKFTKTVLPMILMAIFNNLKDSKAAESFIKALGDHEGTEDAIVGNVTDALFDKMKHADLEDGAKILKHILGDNVDAVVSEVSNHLGVDSKAGSDIINSLAPSVLEMIAQKTKGNRTTDSVVKAITDELNEVDAQEGMPNLPSTFKNILGGQADGDGILDKVFGDKEDDSNILVDLVGQLMK